jgi:hypothetical protein
MISGWESGFWVTTTLANSLVRRFEEWHADVLSVRGDTFNAFDSMKLHAAYVDVFNPA